MSARGKKRAFEGGGAASEKREKQAEVFGLERYALGRTLGSGGFASVRLAYDSVDKLQVCVARHAPTA